MMHLLKHKHVIALDYDGTFSEASKLWDRFLEHRDRHNVFVFVVTMRFSNEIDDEFGEHFKNFAKNKIPVIFTGRLQKQKFVESLGLKVNVWIDDNPHFIFQDAFAEHYEDNGKLMNRWHLPEYDTLRSTAESVNYNLLTILESA